MAAHNEFGTIGEQKAILFLKQNGYTIINTNWRSQHLEIDIIAKKDETLCIVEVKSRTSNQFGETHAAFTKQKQINLLKAANDYIEMYKIDLEIRFDLICITKERGQLLIEHFKNVFVPFLF